MSARWAWLCLLAAAPAQAFWGKNHGSMIGWVIDQGKWPAFQRGSRPVVTVDDYLQQVLYLRDGKKRDLQGVDFTTPSCFKITAPALLDPTCDPPKDKPTDSPDTHMSFSEWAQEGGIAEDGFKNALDGAAFAGVRAVNHFHTPFASKGHPEGGFTGVFPGVNIAATVPIFEGLFRPGISAADWANGASSGGYANQWGWPAAHSSLRRFFTEQRELKREGALAAAARSLGQVQHLIEDNAIPDHSRDVPHPFKCFEDYVKGHSNLIHLYPPWTTFPLSAIETAGFRGFWDRDLYDGSNPAVTQTDSDPVGISEFSNANFFAYNESDLGWARYSDIPESPSTWTEFPNPQWVTSNDVYVPPAAPALSTTTAIAHKPGPIGVQPVHDPHMWVDDKVWGIYSVPLITHLLGYSLSTWPLLFGQARAEIVPDSTEPMTHARVRIYNLAPPSTPYATTWALDAVSVLPILPEGMQSSLFGTNQELQVTFAGGTTVAPGNYAESQPFEITAQQRTFFFYAAYTAVLVNAHLGSSKQTPLEFGIPIPNAYPLLEQLDLADTTGGGSAQKTCATDPKCGSDQSNVVIYTPFTQHLKMNLSLKAPNVDILYAKLTDGDGALRKALQEDVRLAGMGVVSFIVPNSSTFPSLSMPRYPNSSTFTVGPPAELASGVGPKGTWLRLPNLEDKAEDPNIPLELDLNLKDFITSDFEALQASFNTDLVVWTTSGAMFLMHLYLWPVFDQKDAATVANGVGCSENSLSVAFASVQQVVLQNSMTCEAQQYSYAWQYPPMTGGMGFASGMGGLDVAAGATLETLLRLKLTQVGNSAVTPNSMGVPSNNCTATDFQFFLNTVTGACTDGAQAFGYQSEQTQVTNCSLPNPQNMPRQATLSPMFTNADDALWVTMFNLKKSDQPSWSLTAH